MFMMEGRRMTMGDLWGVAMVLVIAALILGQLKDK